ncbi:MAG: hypothetical protein HY313_12050 [Acidobacteria bacterium]|nr:hypothetical protein [Acidobacteriota bacterium]
MRRTFGLFAVVVLLGMIVLSRSIGNTETTEEPAVYSTSSVTFNFAKHRLEWEMLRTVKPNQLKEQTDTFYIDLDRGVMGHAGQERKISENLWLSIGKLFHALDGFVITHTSPWVGPEDPEKQTTGAKSHI